MSLFSKIFGVKGKHTSDSPEFIQQQIADGSAVILDVRSQQEWDAGHLEGAIFIPIDDLKQLPAKTDALESLDKSKVIYCHCKAGVRARMAADILTPMGYQVQTLQQSYEKLVGQGFKPAS